MRTEKIGFLVRWSCLAACAAFGAWMVPTLVRASQKATGAAHAPEVVTVTGEVVDLWCYIDHKGHGEKHKTCAVTCAEAGNPIGILETTGHLYLAMGGKKHQPGRELLIDHMAETVTATGKLIKEGGIEAIYISSLKQ